MISQLVLIDLKRAFGQEGCPICRLQREAEERYIGHLLWEYVNDLSARERFLASWGYCARHARILGRLELRDYHDAMGKAIMYESLIQQLNHHLKMIGDEVARNHAPKRLRFLRMPWVRPKQSSSALALTAECYVCEVGRIAEENTLEDLLEGLEGKESEIPGLCQSSDGLCLPHLRSALAHTYPGRGKVTEILIKHAQKRLAMLQTQLSEYVRKLSWDARDEQQTPGERVSWSKAIAFLSGGLMEDVPREAPGIKQEGKS